MRKHVKENKKEKATVSLRKILAISIILFMLTGMMGVMANTNQVKNVKIILSSGYEMNVITSSTKVRDILDENNIVVVDGETVIPDLESDLSDNKTITITKGEVQKEAESITLSEDEILESYKSIVEKVVTVQEEIPFETITKDVSDGSGDTQEKVITAGSNGIKEVTYRIKYQNGNEIERTVVSENVIKEPVDKVVQVKTKTVTARNSQERTATSNPAATASTALAKKVQGITPKVKTFNTSAYCSCAKCCGKTNGITASGAKASSWYTLAAGNGYKLGTVIYIPAFKNKPNGGWFVVQDRGGAISNSKLDVYMGSHSAAIQYGRRSVEAYVYEF